ncbi:MAG: 2-C-methyl-D-erythritol 4-phosphate cytidylyltransferase, partial [Vicinamibacterales bacterium]|nr:2-C-methyl-D-erythritol 4-phosphate cytidylyltransferase [Vicinamibacterales bacterium]
MTKVAAIIAAGGRGTRMGGERPKQHLLLGGLTILQRTVAAFDRSERIDEIVLVVPRGPSAG